MEKGGRLMFTKLKIMNLLISCGSHAHHHPSEMCQTVYWFGTYCSWWLILPANSLVRPPLALPSRALQEKWEVLLEIRLLGATYRCGLSNHQAATAQMLSVWVALLV